MQTLIHKYAQTLLRLAYSYLKDTSDAEDVVQEVFMQMYSDAPEFQSEEHERAWLFRVTINRCKNHLRCPWNRRISTIMTQLQRDRHMLRLEMEADATTERSML